MNDVLPRVLFVSQTAIGTSTSNRYVQLCSHLSRRGYRITLFFVGKGKAADDARIRYPRRIQNVRVTHTPAFPTRLLGKSGALSAALSALFLLATCIPHLVVACMRADIVVLGKPLPFGAFAVSMALLIARKPLVLDMDDWEGVGGFATLKQGKSAFAKAVITFFEEWLPPRSAAVVVVSRLLATRVRLMRVPEDRIFYVPNGADIEAFSPGVDGSAVRKRHELANRLVLAYLGTFKPGGASWDFMLDAFKVVHDARQDVVLMVVGFGPGLQDAQRYAAQLGVEKRVVFAGKVEHAAVAEYLAAADILILPYTDTFPDTYVNVGRSSLKLYEYMAMGKPIVASDIGELHESLRDGGGALAKANTADSFAREIVALLGDAQAMQRYGAEARRRAETLYNYETLAAEFEKALKRAAT